MMGIGMVGIELQGPFIVGDGLLEPRLPLVTKSANLVNVGAIGVQFSAEIVIGDRLIKPLSLEQQRGAAARSLLVARTKLQRVLKG